MNNNLNKAKLGIFGGSGFYSIENLRNIKEISIDTPYGSPSDTLRVGELEGMEVVFLARHGRHHSFTPTEVPYQANIWAMKSLGVKWIISASAVGSLKEEIKPLDMVIPDQFIDRTKDRPNTFWEWSCSSCCFNDPFCNKLREILAEVTKPIMPKDRNLHLGGTSLHGRTAFSTEQNPSFTELLDVP